MLSPLRNRAGKRLREPFGKAGLTVAVIALVFAMLGGAYAASGLNSKQKKEVKSIAKSFQGTGPAGAQGAAGAKGDNGSNGAQGAKGDTGNTGSPGTAGKSAEAIPFSGSKGPIGGVTCTEGGLEVKSASATTLVCNGKKGQTGFTETLPAGKTETGTWSSQLNFSASGKIELAPISFNIPLAETPSLNWINWAGEAKQGSASNCPGSVSEPAAEPENLCLYSFEGEEPGELGFGGKVGGASIGSPGGFVLQLEVPPLSHAGGTWAVTAEEE